MFKKKIKLFIFFTVCIMSFTATASVLTVILNQPKDNQNPTPTQQVSNSSDSTQISSSTTDKPTDGVEPAKVLRIQVQQNVTGDELEDKSKLEKIIIESGATTIESGAFEGCTSLKEVVFMENESALIKAGAFKNCTNLKSLIINVNCRIEAGAFEGVSLNSVEIMGVGTIHSSIINLNLDIHNDDLTIVVFQNFTINGFTHKAVYDTESYIFSNYDMLGEPTDNILMFVTKD